MFKGLKERLKAVKQSFGSHVEEVPNQSDAITELDVQEVPDAVLASDGVHAHTTLDNGNVPEVREEKKGFFAKTFLKGNQDDFSQKETGEDTTTSDAEKREIEEGETTINTESTEQDISSEDFNLAGSDKKAKTAKPGLGSKIKAFVVSREFVIDQKQIDEPLYDLEFALLENDVALSATDAIISSVREDLSGSTRKMGTSVDDVVTSSLKRALLDVLGDPFDLPAFIADHEKPVKIIFVGVNGTGKTTSIAKLASYLTKQGISVVIGAGDTFRAGAIEQIDVHAKRLGTKVIQHQEGSDPTAVLFDTIEYAKAHHIDVVLGDTAGRFHNRGNLMNQLDKIKRVTKPDLIVYVDEAVAGNDAVTRAEEFERSVGLDGVILTKVDMDPKGGAAISIAHAVGKPLLFIGVGQSYDDLVPFNPEQVVKDLFGEDTVPEVAL
jgi:fused signal recognition particle receptor